MVLKRGEKQLTMADHASWARVRPEKPPVGGFVTEGTCTPKRDADSERRAALVIASHMRGSGRAREVLEMMGLVENAA